MEQSVYEKYELVVGLEVHAQMLTKSKAYSADPTEYGALPNTNVSAVTIAHPGTLPRHNEKVVEYAIKMGLACQSEITRYNIFDRKNYFYPDLPKGYQITQDKTPICQGGFLEVLPKDLPAKKIRLTRIHMEEDSGKSMHLDGEEFTLVDLNRAGVPLIEIVSEPDIRNGEEAYAYLTEIRRLVRYLDICDGNMEEGSLRCDANVSVRLKGSEKFGTKVEVKNMNSIRNVQRAIDHEAKRQIEMVERGEEIISETRGFDAPSGTTYSMRMKETLNDYRYFPEPDLQPLVVTEDYLQSVRAQMPSLPRELRERFTKEYGLPEYDVHVLTDAKEIALYFEALCEHTKNYKAASNWMMGPVKSHLNELTLHIDDFPVTPEVLAAVIKLVDEDKLSFATASQKLFPELLKQPQKAPLALAEEMELIQDSDEGALQTLVEEVLAANPEKVEEYRNGKKGLLGMFMGQIMKKTKGKANPKVTTKLLQERLNG